ncbi:MAG TPA: DUF4221 family protein [Chitinophagaceae bacterium]|jgi:hypothetical protein
MADKQKVIISLFLVVFIFSCKTKKQETGITIQQDSLKIENGFLNKKFNVITVSGTSYFQGYNTSNNELLLFNLNEKIPEFKIKLAINFTDTTVGSLIQFYIYNPDTIFLLTENHILIVDTAGKVKYDKNIGSFLKDMGEEDVFPFDYGNYFPLYFDSRNRDLLMHLMCNCDFFNPSYFTKKIEAKLSLASGKITTFDYHFPERYKHNFYGQNIFPFRIVNGPLNIVSFESDDSLYVFNRETNSLKKYKSRSRYQETNFISFDTSFYNNNNRIDRLTEHITVSPIYEKILFDPYRNLYYRFFLREMSLKNEKGIYNNPLNKDLVIMVLDKNFNIIQENNIGSSYLWYYSFVTPKGLYIQKKSYNLPQNSNPNYAYFSVFTWP